MCGQFEASIRARQMLAEIDESQIVDLSDVVKPTLAAPILIANPETGKPEVAPMRFGLVPHWYRKAFKDWKATTFNARIEEADEKPAFKGAFRYRRAIVPAEAFYEWSGPKTARTKWRFTRADNAPLGFAGLWDEADCLEGGMFSFAILTRPAGEQMSAIHDREPIVLARDTWSDWIRLKPVDLTAPAPLRLANLDAPQSLF
ncbi:SOS response-associated peptidase [Asticcacaulis solisilvae]|uniref:SOS response-associated peptidase n=1 Tax=Asticcacaulis solisilvae TaxID=1217274 RepID=UPI003FD783D6